MWSALPTIYDDGLPKTLTMPRWSHPSKERRRPRPTTTLRRRLSRERGRLTPIQRQGRPSRRLLRSTLSMSKTDPHVGPTSLPNVAAHCLLYPCHISPRALKRLFNSLVRNILESMNRLAQCDSRTQSVQARIWSGLGMKQASGPRTQRTFLCPNKFENTPTPTQTRKNRKGCIVSIVFVLRVEEKKVIFG